MKKSKAQLNLALFLASLMGAGFLFSGAWGATNIPSQAWSRDINAGGYTDGAPIGGFGAGTMTWNFAGDFYLERLNIAYAPVTTGNAPYPVDANAHFYMYQKLVGSAAVEKMLNAATLGSGEAAYHALFPKAWVSYSGPTFPLPVTVTQFSPIIPGDYQRTSYPEGIYEWDATNSQAVSCDFAVMLTFDNSFGGTNAAVTVSGGNTALVLTRNTGAATGPSQGEFALGSQSSTGVTVTYESAAALATLTTAFSTAGTLANTTGNNMIGAIAFKTTLGPGQSAKIPIVLAWDIPEARPGATGPTGTNATWYREYTKYYGGTSTGRTGLNSGAIAMEGLNNYAAWESSIDSWQSGILSGNYPDWLKQMLFNELYYYFTGGTMWEAGKVGDAAYDSKPNMFSSLESYIYDFYGTSDVRFYGSWPLALLWPNIDKQEVEQFCDSVVAGTAAGGLAPVTNTANATCAHDIGDDNGIYTEWNAYVYRDSTTWKDLNSKLVLMVYRAWELTGKSDATFLNYCWPSVQAAMTKVHGQCDATGLPISSGIDQTYDDLGLTGDTAYCGSLFLAACEAAQAMATAEGNSALATTYGTWLSTGQTNFESLLWDNTGGYYHIDTGSTAPTRIMSDQLCGEWYAKALGLPGIVSDAHALSAWTKVHDNNWKKFNAGANGVVNVMTSAGAIDTSYPQSQEAWVGVGWSVAAGLALMGQTAPASEIGYSLYNTIWNTNQLWFRTPEAWQTGVSSIRAPYYMRAIAIWALKQAYDLTAPPTATPTRSLTPTPTLTPSLTSTTTPTASRTASPTPTATLTLSPTASASATSTMTPTSTATLTVTRTSSATASPTGTRTATPTPTLTGTLTATFSATSTPSVTLTATVTPNPIFSPTNTLTPFGTPTRTWTPTSTPPLTATPTLTATRTASATKTPTLTATATWTLSSTPSITPTLTATLTDTPIPTPWTGPSGISAPFPNPSTGAPVTVQLNLTGSYQVDWDVFTTAFRKIAGARSSSLPGGQVVWNLKGPGQEEAANGIYYWRVEVKDALGKRSRIVKVLVLR